MRRRLGVPGIRVLLRLGALCPEGSRRAAARLLVRLAWPFLARERRWARQTLGQARLPFRIPDLGRFLRRVFENFMKAALDLAAVYHRPGLVERLVEEESARALERVIKDLHRRWGRVIYVTCHLGNWEVLGAVATRFVPMAAVARRIRVPQFQRVAEEVRGRLGFRVIYQDEPLRRMLRFLKEGGALALLPDQDIRHNAGVFVPFFGRPAYSPLGPAILSYMAQAPVLPAFMPHHGEGYRIITFEPIPPPPDRRPETLGHYTGLYQRAVERVVGLYPEQWAWFHPRYRTRPEGER